MYFHKSNYHPFDRVVTSFLLWMSCSNNFSGVDAEPELHKTSTRQRREVSTAVLPTICEVSEFKQEDYHKQVMRQRKMSVSSAAFDHTDNRKQVVQKRKMSVSSKKIVTRLVRSGQSGLPRQTEELPEDEEPLLDQPEEPETIKPCTWRGWKMPRKGVKVYPGSCQRRPRAPRVTKVMSPLRLLKTMRDAYVRALTRLGNKCTRPAWSAVGARGGF